MTVAARIDGGEEGVHAPVVARGDASPVFQPAEQDLDALALAVERSVVWDRDLPTAS